MLVQLLNQFLPDDQLEKLFSDDADIILDDPQLAGAMREGTKAAHKAAENSIFTK